MTIASAALIIIAYVAYCLAWGWALAWAEQWQQDNYWRFL